MSRSRIMIGVVTGVAVVAVAAVPSLASSSGEPTSATVPASAAVTTSPTAAGKMAAAAFTAQATTKKPTVKVTTPKTVRSVKLVIPVTTNKVGSNVTGFIQVLDTVNKVSTGVSGASVSLQEKRGAKYVEVASGITGDTGIYPIAFTSDTNSAFRAVLTPTTGKAVYGALVKTTAVAQATWASRPTTSTAAKTKVSYSFRVSPAQGKAQLQIANAKKPKSWLKTTAVAVPNDGVVTGYVVFPSAGTWYVRGSSVATSTIGSGSTSNLTVTVK